MLAKSNNSDIIENRVAASGLMNINLEDFYPRGERVVVDIKDFLSSGLIVREKEFREKVKTTDWRFYEGKLVALHCTAEAIIPLWAYMLITSSLAPFAKKVVTGDRDFLEKVLFNDTLNKIDVEKYRGKMVIINGCSQLPVPLAAFTEIVTLLQPVVKSIMFGEACSTVPIYKSKT